jgi:molybdopterin molybdotransferase
VISFDEALALVAGVATPLGIERVPLAKAKGRVSAFAVRPAIDMPRADVSAMDGYAVRDADLPGRLNVAGESFPGRAHRRALDSAECVRIFTGAAVPVGADRVVIQEEVERDGDAAVFGPAGAARHIRRRGSDFRAGDVVLGAGRLLDPRALVALAGADQDGVDVYRRPSMFVLSTGDELVEPGTAFGTDGAIPESVSPGVAALAQDWGADIAGTARHRDDLPTLERAAAAALGAATLVVVTGGASVGERDFAKAMFAPSGLELLFSKVAIKPGKPVWLGRVGDRLVLGLPGNPTSAMVTARLLLAPLIAGLGGRRPELRWRRAPLAEAIGPCGDRETFVRAAWEGEAVRPFSNQDSSAQKTLADAELLIRRRADAPAAQAGETVEIIDF